MEFIAIIADQERIFLKSVLEEATCFTMLSDGSQARKTGSEKELVFVRVANKGKPVRSSPLPMQIKCMTVSIFSLRLTSVLRYKMWMITEVPQQPI